MGSENTNKEEKMLESLAKNQPGAAPFLLVLHSTPACPTQQNLGFAKKKSLEKIVLELACLHFLQNFGLLKMRRKFLKKCPKIKWWFDDDLPHEKWALFNYTYYYKPIDVLFLSKICIFSAATRFFLLEKFMRDVSLKKINQKEKKRLKDSGPTFSNCIQPE